MRHPNGRCSIEELSPKDFEVAEAVKLDELRRRLTELSYLGEDEPLLPALARFAVVNQVRMTVWPKQLAFAEVAKVSRPLANDPSLIFVLPLGRASSSKRWLEACGSEKAVEYVKGGGARCLRDHPELVQEVLELLGYYGDELNQVGSREVSQRSRLA